MEIKKLLKIYYNLVTYTVLKTQMVPGIVKQYGKNSTEHKLLKLDLDEMAECITTVYNSLKEYYPSEQELRQHISKNLYTDPYYKLMSVALYDSEKYDISDIN